MSSSSSKNQSPNGCGQSSLLDNHRVIPHPHGNSGAGQQYSKFRFDSTLFYRLLLGAGSDSGVAAQ
ncbi:hypothetical protein DERP_007336 [Dermatophagoides pteronyssinus]|uniref:Uncharacterized protein n=1 Tax=Dermatophagoides pteronyssinus TaxID=6956 RepID=A0ABQ8J480_DERPT|nr:hypothetical protein DERP_007336 [Dermatophagoides pteronyssinus]